MKIKDDLLELEQRTWAEVDAVLHSIPLDQWERPGPSADWSVKDVVAHIACWHAECARQLERIRVEHVPAWPDVETFNRQAYDRCRDLTIDEVRAMSAAARHRFREELAQIAPVALTGKIVAEMHGGADEHYAEHLPGLKAFAEGATA